LQSKSELKNHIKSFWNKVVLFIPKVAVLIYKLLVFIGTNLVVRLCNWVGEHNEQIKIGIAVLVGIVTLLGYLNSVKKERIKHSIQYVDRYHGGDIFKARLAVEQFWRRPEIMAELDKIKMKERRVLAKEKTLLDKQIQEPVFILLDFYQEVSLCALSDICHLKTACEFFANDIYDFNFLYQEFFKKWEENWRINFDLEIKDFIQACDSLNLIDRTPYKSD